MIKIPSKTLVPVLSILISSVVLTFFLILPLLSWLQDIVDFYEPALNETTPTIYIKDGHIEFEGHMPQQITLADGVTIFFDTAINDSLINNSPRRSIFIAENEMHIKTKDDIEIVSFENFHVDDDDVVLRPLELRDKLFKYRDKVFTAIAITSVIAVSLLIYIVVNFAAGIGLMVDAFSNGPHSFKQMLNLASSLLLLFIFIGIIFQLNSFRDIKILILLYLVVTGVLVYANTVLVKKMDSMARK